MPLPTEPAPEPDAPQRALHLAVKGARVTRNTLGRCGEG